jgi:membrane protein
MVRVRLAGAWRFLKKVVRAWSEDHAPSMGAALSYYTLFSIAPLLLIVIAIAGAVFGDEAARGEIFYQLRGLMGDNGAQAIEQLLQHADRPKQGAIATLTGAGALLLGATTVFGELQNALDRIWRAPAREDSGWWSILRSRFLSFGMILGIAFLLMVSLVVSALLAALGKWWGPAFGALPYVGQAIDLVVSFGLSTLMFAMIYKLIPRVRIHWRDVWIGAAVTAALFTLGKFLIGLYLGRSSVASAFGAFGSLAVMMVWVYYSAQIFLLGCEFTWVWAHVYGSRRHTGEGAAVQNAAPESTRAQPGAGTAPAASPPAFAPSSGSDTPPEEARRPQRPLLRLGAFAALVLAGQWLRAKARRG